MTALILHPKTVDLYRRRDALRAELAGLLRQRLHLLFEELPALRYRYTELFGPLERAIEEKTLEMSERKRMAELLILKLDRGQTLDAKTIALTMKIVYNEFQRLRTQVERMAGKQQRTEGRGFHFVEGRAEGTERLTHAEIDRRHRDDIRRLYRTLAKRLHPDRNGDHDPLRAAYWEMTRNAYDRRDLDLLRTLANVVVTGPALMPSNAPAGVAEEIVNLLDVVAKERVRLLELRGSEPYATREKFDDERWVAAKQEGLRRRLEELEKEVKRYDELLAPILSRSGDLVRPENVPDLWSNFLEDVYLSGRF